MIEKKNSIARNNLFLAAEKAGCTKAQAEEIWKILNHEGSLKTGFDLVHVIYYLGGLIIYCALAWLIWEGDRLYGNTTLFSITSTAALISYGLGIYLWKIKRDEVLGGIGLFLSLALIPFVTYLFQDMLGWWSDHDFGRYKNFDDLFHGGWFLIEITTLVLTAITLRLTRFPFLGLILFSTLWLMSEDILPLCIRKLQLGIPKAHLEQISRVVFGCSLILWAFILDRKEKVNFAFWAYLFGALSFWEGMTFAYYKTEWGHLSYCLSSVSLFALGPILKQRVFILFGMTGIITYLGKLAWRHFSTSAAFPFILTFIGLAVIVIGLLFQQYAKKKETSTGKT